MNINAHIIHCLDNKGWKNGYYASLRYSDTGWFKRDKDVIPVKIEVREPSIDIKKLESLL